MTVWTFLSVLSSNAFNKERLVVEEYHLLVRRAMKSSLWVSYGPVV